MPGILKVKKTGSIPECEIIVGHTHYGQYQVGRYYAQDTKPEVVSGDNVTPPPDIFPITATATVAQLDNNRLYWAVLVVSYSGGTASYSVTVIIRQDGNVLDRQVKQGALVNGMAPAHDGWNIELV